MATGRYDTINLNRTLTNIAVANVGLGGPFVADQLSPIIPVSIRKGTYYKFSNTEAHRDDYDTKRAPKTEAHDIERSYSESTFVTEQRALRELIADEEREEADAIINPEMDSVSLLVRKLQLGRE
ncbi:MAG: hypothetical protein IIC00_09625, partial [Planctomycetes bacterium]|nr:hypothetical protein [Planctomycetota bacterium]